MWLMKQWQYHPDGGLSLILVAMYFGYGFFAIKKEPKLLKSIWLLLFLFTGPLRNIHSGRYDCFCLP